MTRFPLVSTARLNSIDDMLLASGWTRDEIGWIAPEDYRDAVANQYGKGHVKRAHAAAAQILFDEALTAYGTRAA